MRESVTLSVESPQGTWGAASLLCAFADLDGTDAELKSFATVYPMNAETIHAFTKANVRYIPASWQQLVSPMRTLERGYGVCVDSARLIVGLARQNGYKARLVYFTQDEGLWGTLPPSIAHVAAQIFDKGQWVWAEATVDAYFGEYPLTAAARLGVDVSGLRQGPMCPSDNDDEDDNLACPVPLNAPAPGQTIGGAGPSALPARLLDFPAALLTTSDLVNPLEAVRVLLNESGGSLNPAAKNPRGFAAGEFAIGINQFAPVNWKIFAPLSPEAYAGLTAAEQMVPYVARFWRQEAAGAVAKGASLPLSGRDLYWLNFLPARYVANAPDGHVIVPPGDGFYEPNASLDHGKKGFITAGDLQLTIDAQANNPLYPALAAAIGASPGAPSSLIATAAKGALIVGLAVALGAAAGQAFPNAVHLPRGVFGT